MNYIMAINMNKNINIWFQKKINNNISNTIT